MSTGDGPHDEEHTSMNLESLIVRTERGVMRRLPPAFVLWANARLHRMFGEPELHELPRLVRRGSIAIDVGAHFGTFSYTLARLVGKQGLVLSFEPIEEDAILIKNTPVAGVGTAFRALVGIRNGNHPHPLPARIGKDGTFEPATFPFGSRRRPHGAGTATR
jgi:hypothetical protein